MRPMSHFESGLLLETGAPQPTVPTPLPLPHYKTPGKHGTTVPYGTIGTGLSPALLFAQPDGQTCIMPVVIKQEYIGQWVMDCIKHGTRVLP